jgi:hypothetical protein
VSGQLRLLFVGGLVLVKGRERAREMELFVRIFEGEFLVWMALGSCCTFSLLLLPVGG